ncbi:MAG: hypothetical protein AAB819_00585 [Patescibacteria group bacterium]
MQKFIVALILLIVVGGVAGFLSDRVTIACPADAKLCPDGSVVGRTGLKCEFAECLAVNSGGGNQGILPYKSGVKGIVTRGPMCPVVRGGDNSCADRPFSTDVYLHRIGSDKPFANVVSDTKGQFQFNVPPGDYTVNAKNDGISKTCSPIFITIGSDEMKSADISCDTGIR